ncbi:peptidoglycan-binding domain-containing protein [Aquamicrobium terrae]
MKSVRLGGGAVISLALLLSFFAGSTIAATKNGEFASHGLGALSCEAALHESDGFSAGAAIERVSAWIDGYISSHNRLTAGTYDAVPITDGTALARLAISVCRANPGGNFERTVDGIVEAFANGSISGKSPVVEVRSGKETVLLRRAVLRRTQEELTARGFLRDGSTDGIYGPATRKALLEFQRSAGTPESGVPDAETLARLFAMGKASNGGMPE